MDSLFLARQLETPMTNQWNGLKSPTAKHSQCRFNGGFRETALRSNIDAHNRHVREKYLGRNWLVSLENHGKSSFLEDFRLSPPFVA